MGLFKNKSKYGYGYGYYPEENNSKVHEAIKTLRSNIIFSGIDEPIKTIAVTSSIPNEGKTVISHFLATEMAKAGNKTLIVECDLRRPAQANLFKSRPKKGLTKYLSGDCTLEEAATVTNTENLYFLDADSKVVNPAETLGSERFKKAMEEMKEKFDTVILDTPPVTSFIDGALVASNSDATVVVIRAGYTPQRAVAASIDQLEKANAKIIGTVLNGIEDTESGQYYKYGRSRSGSYKYSYYSYENEAEKAEVKQGSAAGASSEKDEFSDLYV